MEGVREFLENLRKNGLVMGHLRAVFHIVIGRRITKSDGSEISSGITWRQLATLLKDMRWDPDQVSELGIDASGLPPRDRLRYWYGAISQAEVDSEAARKEANDIVKKIEKLGYKIGAAPGK